MRRKRRVPPTKASTIPNCRGRKTRVIGLERGSIAAKSKNGFPVLVRPSYVRGGRAMVIAFDEDTIRESMKQAL